MIHRNTVEFEVAGDYALFSDPAMRVGGGKCSLQTPTYEALKGILSSIYWKPSLIWIIDAVRIMNPIRTEVKAQYHGGDRYTYLKDCRYQVRAHFIWNENRPELSDDHNEHKHHNIARRMIERGGQRDIFLGTRECPGYVGPCTFNEGPGCYDDTAELAFGLIYHGITYADEAYSEETKGKLSIRFWYPVMRWGIIQFDPPPDCPVTRVVRDAEIKPFGVEHADVQGLAEFGGEVDRWILATRAGQNRTEGMP